MSPLKRFFLRNLTLVCPWLDRLWHGDTLRSEFTLVGHKVEIYQREGSAGPYELVIDGKRLTWEELTKPHALYGRGGPWELSIGTDPETGEPIAQFPKHIGEATDAAAVYIRELNAGRRNRK